MKFGLHKCMQIYIYIHIHISLSIYACIYIYIHTCVCVYSCNQERILLITGGTKLEQTMGNQGLPDAMEKWTHGTEDVRVIYGSRVAHQKGYSATYSPHHDDDG